MTLNQSTQSCRHSLSIYAYVILIEKNRKRYQSKCSKNKHFSFTILKLITLSYTLEIRFYKKLTSLISEALSLGFPPGISQNIPIAVRKLFVASGVCFKYWCKISQTFSDFIQQKNIIRFIIFMNLNRISYEIHLFLYNSFSSKWITEIACAFNNVC